MNDMAEQEAAKCSDMLRHNAGCRVHSLQNINKKRDMDTLCDHLVMHLPTEVNYNVPRPVRALKIVFRLDFTSSVVSHDVT